MADTEREDLESGIDSHFWKRVCQMVEADWGPVGYAEKVSRVVSVNDDGLALDKLRQLAVMRDEAMRFVQWPQKRLDVLNHKAEDAPLSIAERVIQLRAQDHVMAGMPRRGRG